MRLIKKYGKSLIVSVLSWQTRRLLKRHSVKVVGVVGSYGKTSTKMAVAKVLSKQYRVCYQNGNYNDLLTVPLIFFQQSTPSLLNALAWLKIFIDNERQIKRPYPFDIVVVEVGTDGPGQIAAFEKYLKLDFLVVTAIAFEHMEFFPDIRAVAEEELSAQKYSKYIVYNGDLCDPEYMMALPKMSSSFGFNKRNDYVIDEVGFKGDGYDFTVKRRAEEVMEARSHGLAKVQLYSATAAMIIAEQLQIPKRLIKEGIAGIKPVSGRMQMLTGIKGSVIIDETYNASPEAVKAALDIVYEIEAPQKIALLGNMNEMGAYSQQAHETVGDYCDAKQLELVITLGEDANKYLAPHAESRGCKVITATSPYEAGDILKQHIKERALVLVKGSQNNVFAEEAVKYILANPKDAYKLVRQSPYWLRKKRKTFGI